MEALPRPPGGTEPLSYSGRVDPLPVCTALFFDVKQTIDSETLAPPDYVSDLRVTFTKNEK